MAPNDVSTVTSLYDNRCGDESFSARTIVAQSAFLDVTVYRGVSAAESRLLLKRRLPASRSLAHPSRRRRDESRSPTILAPSFATELDYRHCLTQGTITVSATDGWIPSADPPP